MNPIYILRYGGGIGSVTLYHMARLNQLPGGMKISECVFPHGNVSKGTSKYFQELPEAGFPMTEMANEVYTRDVPLFQNDGKQDKRNCTYMLEYHFEDYVMRKYGELRQPIIVVVGAAADQINRVKTPLMRTLQNIHPLVTDYRWSTKTCIKYLMENSIVPPVECAGCTFCPYRSAREWGELSEPDKNLALRLDNIEKRNKRTLFYPLHDQSNRPTWDDECSGFCNM